MTALMPLEDALAHAELVREQLPMTLAEHALLALSDALVAAYAENSRVDHDWRERHIDRQAEYQKQIAALERRLENTPAPPASDYCGKGVCALIEGHEGECSA